MPFIEDTIKTVRSWFGGKQTSISQSKPEAMVGVVPAAVLSEAVAKELANKLQNAHTASTIKIVDVPGKQKRKILINFPVSAPVDEAYKEAEVKTLVKFSQVAVKNYNVVMSPDHFEAHFTPEGQPLPDVFKDEPTPTEVKT